MQREVSRHIYARDYQSPEVTEVEKQYEFFNFFLVKHWFIINLRPYCLFWIGLS